MVARGLTYDELRNLFGPRNPQLDEQSVGGDLLGSLIWIGVDVFVILVGVIVLIVVLVRRARRWRAQQGPDLWGAAEHRSLPRMAQRPHRDPWAERMVDHVVVGAGTTA